MVTKLEFARQVVNYFLGPELDLVRCVLGIDVSAPPSISTEWEGADIRLQVLYCMVHLQVYGLQSAGIGLGVMLGFYEMRDSVFGVLNAPESARSEMIYIHVAM